MLKGSEQVENAHEYFNLLKKIRAEDRVNPEETGNVYKAHDVLRTI